MQKNTTISDIIDLMGRIGCYNKAKLDTQRHLAYLNESLNVEDWEKGAYNQRDLAKGLNKKTANHNNKIEITPSYAILYNVSSSSAIQSIIKQGPSWEYCKKHAYGKGVYTNLQEYQAHESAWINRQGYGDTICRYRYNGNILKEFLVLIPEFWNKSGDIIEQCKRFKGFEEYLYKHNFDPKTLQNSCRGNTSAIGAGRLRDLTDRGTNKHKLDNLYHFNDTGFYGPHIDDALMQFGIQGFLYYGDTDGGTAIVFNSDKLQLLSYCTLPSHRSSDREGLRKSDLKWVEVPNAADVKTNIKDCRPIIHFFKDKYEGNPIYLRPYCGEIIMMDKNTKKWTFIDVEKASEEVLNQRGDDVRLFGDFEFEKVQNFENIDGKELAFVQIDKDENSQFFIDKTGSLYKNPQDRPFSHINSYYPNEKQPDNDAVPQKKSLFDLSDDDMDLLKGYMTESLENEARTETNDGHIELDNFDIARRIMKFNNSDDAYFIQLAERHKDHPYKHYAHNACDYKSFFEVTSIEHLNAIEPVIKKLCQMGEWRAMLYINPRSMTQTRQYANDVFEPKFKKHNSHMQGHEVEVAYGQDKDWPNRPLCFVDVDNEDPKIHKQVLDYIKKMGLKPLEVYNTTNNGLHIILPDKEEAKKLDFSFLDNGKKMGIWATASLEIDKSMTLYAYVKAHGYGKQKQMQQNLGKK